MPSYGQHLPVSNNYRQLYLLTVFIFMLRRGATVDTATSDDRLESVNITEPPSAIVQHNTTKPTPVGPQNITTLVAPGQTCGGYDGSNVVHKLQNLWDCQPRFRHGIYAGGAVFIVLIVPLVFLVTLRCRRRAYRVERINRIDSTPIHHVFPDVDDNGGQAQARYVETPQNTSNPCVDYLHCPNTSRDRESLNPKYANVKTVQSCNGHGTCAAGRHSCHLKRPINKDSLYGDILLQEGMLHDGEYDDLYVPPQSMGEHLVARMRERSSKEWDHENVPSPLGSTSTQDIHSPRQSKISNVSKPGYGMNSRSVQGSRGNSYTGSSSSANKTGDLTADVNDDIYVNTSVSPTDSPYRNIGRQGSGTSSKVNNNLLQPPVKPRYKARAAPKRSRDKKSCSNSERSQKSPISNTSSVYDDVMSDGAHTDGKVYINVEYPPSGSERGDSEVFEGEVYDDTYAVTDNRTPPPPRCKPAAEDESYYIDMSRGSSQSTWRESQNDPLYLVVLNE